MREINNVSTLPINTNSDNSEESVNSKLKILLSFRITIVEFVDLFSLNYSS